MRVVRQHTLSLQKQLSVVGIIQCLLTLSYFQRCWQICCPVRMLCCKRGTDDPVWQADGVQLRDTARRRNKTAWRWGVFSHLGQGLIRHGWSLVNRLCGYEKGSQIWTNYITWQVSSSCNRMTCRCFHREMKKLSSWFGACRAAAFGQRLALLLFKPCSSWSWSSRCKKLLRLQILCNRQTDGSSTDTVWLMLMTKNPLHCGNPQHPS